MGNASDILYAQAIKTFIIYVIRGVKVTFLAPLVLLYYFLAFIYFCVILIGLSKVGIMPTPAMLESVYGFFQSSRAEYIFNNLIGWGVSAAFFLSFLNTAYRTVTKKKRDIKKSLRQSSIAIVVLWVVGITLFFLGMPEKNLSQLFIFYAVTIVPSLFLNASYMCVDYFSDTLIEALSKPVEQNVIKN